MPLRSRRRPSGSPAAAARPRSRRACRTCTAWPLPDFAPGADVDLSPAATRLPTAPGAPPALAALAAPGALGAHGEARLYATRELANAEPATIHLGLDLFAPRAARCARRWTAASSSSASGDLVLSADGSTLRLAGLAPAVDAGESVAAGALSGISATAGRCRRTCTCRSRTRPRDVPGLARPALADAWLALCPHPGALLGLPAPEPAEDALLARRRAVIPHAQPLYFDDPPEMVRGFRQHLYDAQDAPTSTASTTSRASATAIRA